MRICSTEGKILDPLNSNELVLVMRWVIKYTEYKSQQKIVKRGSEIPSQETRFSHTSFKNESKGCMCICMDDGIRLCQRVVRVWESNCFCLWKVLPLDVGRVGQEGRTYFGKWRVVQLVWLTNYSDFPYNSCICTTSGYCFKVFWKANRPVLCF